MVSFSGENLKHVFKNELRYEKGLKAGLLAALADEEMLDLWVV